LQERSAPTFLRTLGTCTACRRAVTENSVDAAVSAITCANPISQQLAWVWPVKSGAPDVDNLDPKEYKLPPTEPLGGARLGKFGIIGLCGQEEHGIPVEWCASPVPA